MILINPFIEKLSTHIQLRVLDDHVSDPRIEVSLVDFFLPTKNPHLPPELKHGAWS